MDKIISSLVGEFQKNFGLVELPEPEAFEAFTAYCVLKDHFDGEFSPDDFRTGGGNDLGIDAFGILLDGELFQDADEVRTYVEKRRRLDVQIVLVQAKTSSNFEGKVISDLADNIGHIIRGQALPYQASEDIKKLRDCLSAVYGNIAKLAGALPELHVYYATTGDRVADMVRSKAESARELLAGTGRVDPVEFHCLTKDDLRGLYRKATTKVKVQFPMPRKMSLPRVPAVEQSLHGLLSAKDLVEKILSDEHGRLRKSLFHGNVRDYLGQSNAVNRSIAKTLEDRDRREQFAVLNNGITIVTQDLHVVGDEVHLDDFEIVNGCQTCHVLFENRERLTDGVQVSVRIVHTRDEEVINGIVGATNRQTVINEEDLTVRESFHRLLEDYFSHDGNPERALFYERRIKQYENRKVEKTRIVTRAVLIRSYLAMFLGQPTRRGHYKSLIASDSGELFGEKHQPVWYYTAASAHYRLEWLLRNGHISKKYAPYRFHLLGALKLHVLGDVPVQHSQRVAERECRRLLDLVWNKTEAEPTFLRLIKPLQRAIDAEEEHGVSPAEMVRTQRFAKRVREEVLGGS